MEEIVATTKEYTDALLRKGVRKLKILGFSHVTFQTILSNEMYRLYFLKFLNERESCGHTNESLIDHLAPKPLEEL